MNFAVDVRKTLCSSLRSGRLLSKESILFEKVLKNTLLTRVSSCLFIIGSKGSGKQSFVQSCLSKSILNADFKVVMIDGEIIPNDNQAIMSLASQLFVGVNGMNASMNLDVIQCSLRQSYATKRPIIIIIRNVENFATKKRQVFLYLLLDLMHRKDLLFFVIGLTSSLDINELLEKRVKSRLNAAYMYIPKLSPTLFCQEVITKLTLPLMNDSTPSTSGIDSLLSKYMHENTLQYNEFVKRFNSEVCSLFSVPVAPDAQSAASATATAVPTSINTIHAVYNLLRCAIGWGCSYESLVDSLCSVIEQSCCTMTDNDGAFHFSIDPLLLGRVFTDALEPNRTPVQVLLSCGLSRIEVYILIACVRLYKRELAMICERELKTNEVNDTDTSNVADKTIKSSKSTAAAEQVRMITWAQILAECRSIFILSRSATLPGSSIGNSFSVHTSRAPLSNTGVAVSFPPHDRMVLACQRLISLGILGLCNTNFSKSSVRNTSDSSMYFANSMIASTGVLASVRVYNRSLVDVITENSIVYLMVPLFEIQNAFALKENESTSIRKVIEESATQRTLKRSASVALSTSCDDANAAVHLDKYFTYEDMMSPTDIAEIFSMFLVDLSSSGGRVSLDDCNVVQALDTKQRVQIPERLRNGVLHPMQPY